jgi:hypothetical protein
MPIAVNPQTGETVYLTSDGQWSKAQTAVNPQTKEMLAFDGQGWKPVPAQSKGMLGYIDDAVRSIASGVTFGFADEFAAKMDEVTGRGGTYEENVARERARDKQIPAAIAIPGEIAGAVGSTIAAAPVRVPLAAATGLAELPAMARYAAGGAAGGALFGAGNAEEDKRLQGAAVGAGIGAGVGAIAPKIASGVASAYGTLRGAVSPQANVTADLGRAITRDQTTPGALIQAVEEAQAIRPGIASLGDVGGENVRGLVERVAQTPGAGRTTVIPALTARQQSQMTRLSDDIQTLTGTRQTATQAIADTMEQRATAAKPLYDEAFTFDAATAPEVVTTWQHLTSTGWGQHIVRSPEFRRTLQTEYGVKNAAEAPLMVQIDAFKKAADDVISDSMRNGANNRARVVQGMRDTLLSVTDQANPTYAKARDAWAGPSRYLDAVKEGRNILGTRVSAEELAAGLSRMGEVEQEAFRIGAVSAITAKMGSDTARLGDMTKYLRSPEMRAKIAAIMPTPEARAEWAKRLDFETSSSELTGRALGNSATARRLAERQDADSIVMDLVTDAFAGSPPVSLLRQMVTAVPRKVRDTLRSRSDAILAELLTDPQAMDGLRKALERVTARDAGPSALRSPTAISGTNSVVFGQQ